MVYRRSIATRRITSKPSGPVEASCVSVTLARYRTGFRADRTARYFVISLMSSDQLRESFKSLPMENPLWLVPCHRRRLVKIECTHVHQAIAVTAVGWLVAIQREQGTIFLMAVGG